MMFVQYLNFRYLYLLCLNLIGTCTFVSSVFAVPEDYASLIHGIKKVTLDNGFRVIIAERHDAPVFNAQLWVKVGSVDELQGKSGAAHLLEHMAFKGTEDIGTKDFSKERELLEMEDQLIEEYHKHPVADTKKRLDQVLEELELVWTNGEFTKLFEQRGAKGLNAATSSDYTMYTINLPASELEFWLFMESERLIRPVFRQFYKELQVVHEERRMRTDDDPSGKLYEALLGSAYWGHPYQAPTIGWKSDLNNLKREDAKYLHTKYYRPDNMVAVIVGDVDSERLIRLANDYFGRIPKVDKPIESRPVPLAAQSGERVIKVKFKAEPEFLIGYHKPTYPDPQSAHLSLLYSILDEGRSSPFQKILVQEKKVASSIYTTEAPGERYDPLFIIGGTPSPGISTEKLISEIDSLLKSMEVSTQMLDAAKKRIKVQILSGLSSNPGLASYLGKRDVIYGDWMDLFKELEQVENTTVEDIKLVIKKYLISENRTITMIDSD